MRYLMIHWIDEAVLAESAAIESEVEAWTAEMDRTFELRQIWDGLGQR
ncbi:MAG: hypothetical protein ACHP9Z_18330 [Streptosporangiales bacterium]